MEEGYAEFNVGDSDYEQLSCPTCDHLYDGSHVREWYSMGWGGYKCLERMDMDIKKTEWERNNVKARKQWKSKLLKCRKGCGKVVKEVSARTIHENKYGE